MSVGLVLTGTIIICLVLWEVFHDLFHPSTSGAVTRWVARALLAAANHDRKRLATVGPLTIVLVILIWVAGLVVGFACIYYPVYPFEFRTSTGQIPHVDQRFLTSVYYSFETLVTLGYGDVVPNETPVRFAAACEALLGFAIVTASVSSILLIFPALTRSRHLALGVSHLFHAEQKTGLTPGGGGSDVILAGLARDVTQARIDLVLFPVVYYFAPENPDSSLAKWTGVLSRYARDGLASDQPKNVRIAAAALDSSLDALGDHLATHFADVARGDRDAAFEAMAAHHSVARVQ